MEADKVNALVLSDGDYDSLVSLSTDSVCEIVWWQENVVRLNGKPISYKDPAVVVTTDASLEGWGAVMDGISIGGQWSAEESKHFINFLELKAIQLALLSFCKTMVDVHVAIRSDNTTAISYINNLGGSKSSLFILSKSIWIWCQERDIVLSRYGQKPPQTLAPRTKAPSH
ncbi:hypothetical protein CI610_03152 [invertebrate metagenome]|uniref:RNase H type-1 domain-containing protein n=1 Tax=invertebrate metagenome TaxID=1711999 RepID=A0A2H9T3V6_9ZZZZ